MTTETMTTKQTTFTPHIDSLLSSRLFLAPKLVNDRLYFISNLSGRMSLYVMDRSGSVPEPLLPPDIALQNPELLQGTESYAVFPELGRIVVLIDRDGDENYEPMVIPIEGGIPEPAFGDDFSSYRVMIFWYDEHSGRMYLHGQAKTEPSMATFRADLPTGEVEELGRSMYGSFPAGVEEGDNRAILIDGYSAGDHVVYLWERGAGERRLLYGTPIEQRKPGETYEPNGINVSFFTDNNGLLFGTSLFDDSYGLGYLSFDAPQELKPVRITGTRHTGRGELNDLRRLHANRFRVNYNIDGVSWAYEGTFDERRLELELDTVLVGKGPLANGTLEAIYYDPASDRYALSFSTATSPTQLFTLEGPNRTPVQHTNERILGIPRSRLSPGEDASFTSYDGLRISARLYLPAEENGFSPPYPLVYYIHGGPQSQERPNFAWFSMPLIQFLTLNGFAVFVPNVRGSTGYGSRYMKHVDHDWGGQDRLDHVHAMTEVLPKDSRIAVKRAGVMGRSYGGYMTLTMAARHADLWKAAIDMFGPYDLTTFVERVPETWKPLTALMVGDPVTERDFLLERSPRTYMDNLACPMLVIQGKNDPRVVEQESRELVEELKGKGKDVEYLMFENEGHDVLKYENKVRCYNAITDFFKARLV